MRPALANDLVAYFQEPTVNALSRLAKKQSRTMQSFSEAVTELRVVPPDTQQAPFDVELIFLLDDVGISAEAVDALDAVAAEIRGAVDPELVRITDVRIRSEEQMSVAEYFSSVPLFLDSMTYRGDEIRGAELPTTD